MTEGTVADTGDRAGRRLTPREREVLEHAARGLSNREIGAALSIAEQTVKNHLGSAMRKLSINDRTHAVVIAIGEGLIALPERADAARSKVVD
jgi:DNA-binding NarL/FixJ family response regulator